MRYRVLAVDYDGTLAHDGKVDDATVAALRRFRASGRKLLMVTGRVMPELRATFGHVELFERIVAENGALVVDPVTGEERTLTATPKPEFVATLKKQGVSPISTGRVIVATWEPHEKAVLKTIRDMGLELQIIFNKGAVMILPTGVNKATGLKAALKMLGEMPESCVAAGDAENDHAMLALAGVGVAVANALPAVKERADLVTNGDHGAGVAELIDRILADDLADVTPKPRETAGASGGR
jgi:hydroxymethylpyrimidine pyrophosphatase-like HAD family hydrolase